MSSDFPSLLQALPVSSPVTKTLRRFVARQRGFTGLNLAIFPSAIVPPASVVIRDDQGIEIQRWPVA